MNTDTLSDEEIAARTARVWANIVLEIQGDMPALERRHRRRVGFTIAAAGAGALALTAGTLAVVQATHEQTTYSVQCYSQASTSSTYGTASEPLPINSATGHAGTRAAVDPVSACGHMWREGLVGQQPDPQRDPNSANFPVPPLIACTLANGVGAAFPKGDSNDNQASFCDSLGLTPWSN
jgi:hypothetical protein